MLERRADTGVLGPVSIRYSIAVFFLQAAQGVRLEFHAQRLVVLGLMAQRTLHAIQKIVAAGYEIGRHSHFHRLA